MKPGQYINRRRFERTKTKINSTFSNVDSDVRETRPIRYPTCIPNWNERQQSYKSKTKKNFKTTVPKRWMQHQKNDVNENNFNAVPSSEKNRRRLRKVPLKDRQTGSARAAAAAAAAAVAAEVVHPNEGATNAPAVEAATRDAEPANATVAENEDLLDDDEENEENNEQDEKLFPGYCSYIRNLYKEAWFPKMNDDGEVYITRGVGKASSKNRKILKGSALQEHITHYFPQGHIHYASAPQIRATKYKPPNQTAMNWCAATGTFTKTTEEAPWTEDTMRMAARDFEVPCGTEMILIMPEFFHRDVLRKNQKF